MSFAMHNLIRFPSYVLYHVETMTFYHSILNQTIIEIEVRVFIKIEISKTNEGNER